MIHLLESGSAVVQDVQFLDPGLRREAAVLENVVEFIGAGGEAGASEYVLLVRNVTLRYRRFLALAHVAQNFAGRGSHWGQRLEFRLGDLAAVEICSFDGRNVF
jgi:hypothetical protein